MGVESKFFIMPKSSFMRPSSGKIVELIKRLREAHFLCDPLSSSFDSNLHQVHLPAGVNATNDGFGWQVGRQKGAGTLKNIEKQIFEHGDSDVRLRWPNSNLAKSGLQYPLSLVPEGDSVYLDIEIHLAAETVFYTSEIIEPFERQVACPCGSVLGSRAPGSDEILDGERLPSHCPACHKPTDFGSEAMVVRDGWTGAAIPDVGGVTYRFAIVIDCGKMLPPRGCVVSKNFRSIVEQCLECPTRIMQDYY